MLAGLTSGLAIQAAAYTPLAANGPTLRRTASRAALPAMELSVPQRLQSAAIGAALAASISVSAASAADPWPYSTLLSKVQGDEVAKVVHPLAPSLAFFLLAAVLGCSKSLSVSPFGGISS